MKARKQQQYITGKLYRVIGAAGRAKMMKFVGKANVNSHTFLMFQPTSARIRL